MSWNEPVDLMPGLRTGYVASVFFGTLTPVLGLYVLWNFSAGSWHTASAALIYEYILVGIMLLGVGLLGVSAGKVGWSTIGFRRCSMDWIIRALVLVPLLYAAGTLWRGILQATGLSRLFFPNIAEDQLILASGSSALAAGLGVVITIFTPLAQETLLRGVLFAWLRRHMSFMIAAVASGPIFGLFHINIERIGSAMVFSIAAAALYEASKSLWPAIVMHMTTNAVYFIYLVLKP